MLFSPFRYMYMYMYNNNVNDYVVHVCTIYMYTCYTKVCPDNMKNLVLGVLVDLCENPKVWKHIVCRLFILKIVSLCRLSHMWQHGEHRTRDPSGLC